MTNTWKTMKKPDYCYHIAMPPFPSEREWKTLLGRMTIEEKAAQLMGLWNGGVEDFKPVIFDDPVRMKEIFGKGL